MLGKELYTKIASIAYNGWSDEDKAVMAFGMIPKNRLDDIVKIIVDKLIDVQLKHIDEDVTTENRELARKFINKDKVTEIEKDLSLALYSVAKMEV